MTSVVSHLQSLAPSDISGATAESLREELVRQQMQQNANLARQQRAREREIRAQEIAAQAQRELDAAELQARREREAAELQARQEQEAAEIRARQERQLAELRRQERADQAEEEAQALRLQQLQNQRQLEAALSGDGRSGAGSARRSSRAGSQVTRSSRRPSLRSVLARSSVAAPSLAASQISQPPAHDLLLLDEQALPPPPVNVIAPAAGDEPFPLPPENNMAPRVERPALNAPEAIDAPINEPIPEQEPPAILPRAQNTLVFPLIPCGWGEPGQNQRAHARTPPAADAKGEELPPRRRLSSTPAILSAPMPALQQGLAQRNHGGLSVEEQHQQRMHRFNLELAKQKRAEEEARLQLKQRDVALEDKRAAAIERQLILVKQLNEEKARLPVTTPLAPTIQGQNTQKINKAPAAAPQITMPPENLNRRMNATAHTSITALGNHTADNFLGLPTRDTQTDTHKMTKRSGRSVQVISPSEQHCASSDTPPPARKVEHIESDARDIFMTVSALQSMPGQNHKPFKGSSQEYPSFIMNYQRHTLKLQSEPSLCQQILIGLLDPNGLARKLVNPYYGDPDTAAEDLQSMLDILKMTYGTGRKQSRAQLETLLARPKVPPTEEGLIEFYSELRSCLAVMKKCDRIEDLNSESTLKTLYWKLPEYIQSKWDSLMDVQTKGAEKEVRPSFEQLLKVIREEHRRKTSELHQWKEEGRVNRKREFNKEKGDGKPKGAKINVAMVQRSEGSPLGPTSSHSQVSGYVLPPCLCGPQGAHACIAECPAYIRAADLESKWQLLKQHGDICYRCLRTGHRANRCSEGSCKISGCRSRHHPSLHYGRLPRYPRQTRDYFPRHPNQRTRTPTPQAESTPLIAPPVQPLPGTNIQAPSFPPPPVISVEQRPTGSSS